MKTFGKKVQMIGNPLEKRENKMMSRIKNLWEKSVFFNLQQQIFGKKILLLPEGSPFKMKEPLEKRSKPGCLKVAKLLAQPWCTSPAGRKKGWEMCMFLMKLVWVTTL